MSQKRKYSDQFRASALSRMEQCSNVSALARELGIRRKFLYQWRDEARGIQSGGAAEVPAADGEQERLQQRVQQRLQQRVVELERLVGRQAAELDFFKGALLRVEARRQQRGATGGAASTNRSK